MFLELLKTPGQKESFMNLAYWVATADGGLGYPEIKMMDVFSNETGIASWRRPPGNGEAIEFAVFDDDLSRKIAYSNLLAMGSVEEYANSSQAQAIEKVREALGISPAQDQNYRQWVEILKAHVRCGIILTDLFQLS